MKNTLFLFLIVVFCQIVIPFTAKAQQLVTWGNIVNTTVSSNVLEKTSGSDGWNAGAESKNMLAFGQDGWVEFELQEITKKKAIGLTYVQSSGIAMDSIKCGFIFDFSGSTRVLYTRKLGTNTNIGTYDMNDVFRIEKAGTKVLFLKNGSKIDSCTLSSNSYSFFIDASVYTYGGQFHEVLTSFVAYDSTTVNPNKDAYIHQLYPNNNVGSYIYLLASRHTNSGLYNIGRTLMEFDVSTLPKNAKIVSSKLYLYGVDGDSPTQYGHRCQTYCTGNSAKLYPNNASWDESVVTWSLAPSYDASIYAVLPRATGSIYVYTDYVVETNNLVQKWVDGTKTNYGVTFRVDDEASVYTALQFRSSDHTNTSERPRVEIKYYIGTNYYVNDNSTTGDVYCKAVGSSSNSGLSPYAPVNSVDSVLKWYVLGAKDTIFVDAGSYSEAITFNNTDYGTSAGNLVLYGAGKSKTIFTAPSSKHNLTFSGASFVSIENLTLTTSQINYDNASMNSTSANISFINDSMVSSTHYNFLIDGASNITISNNKVNNSKLDTKQFYITSGSSNISITNNTILNNSGKSIGIYLIANSKTNTAPSNITISDNQITVDSIGIVSIGIAAAYIDNLKIRNNTIAISSIDSLTSSIKITYSGSASNKVDSIYNNRFVGGRYGIWGNYLNYSRVFNNYFTGNTYGLTLASSSNNLVSYNSFNNDRINVWTTTDNSVSGMTLSNNIFYSTGNSSYQNLNINSGSFSNVDYNCFYGSNGALVARHNSTNYDSLAAWQAIDHYTGTGNGDEHSISGDPLYPSTITTDLDIDLFSPCTQAGSTISGITMDINGRVRRSLPSIGAMEPELALYIPLVKNSVFTEQDTLYAQVSGSGIDTTFIVPDSIKIIPTVPLSGYIDYTIHFIGDTSLCDTLPIGFRVNSLGKIDSVYIKDGESRYPLPTEYYHLYAEERAIAMSSVLRVTPYYANLSEKPDGGFYNTVGKRLRLYYNEEYNVPSQGRYLEYNVYNSAMQILVNVQPDGICFPPSAPKKEIGSGLNRIVLDFSQVQEMSNIHIQYYLLEVINEKGEKLYLRFRL